MAEGKRLSERGNYNSLKCFNCGDLGHRMSDCMRDMKKCTNCGNIGHVAVDCRRGKVTCFNCGEPGHLSSTCPKPKKAQSGRQAN